MEKHFQRIYSISFALLSTEKARFQMKMHYSIFFSPISVFSSLPEARKKDKGGYGAIMMMGMMMSKVLGALGFGGVALLAMKALGVSMMALLLSAILGLKKLTESGGDHKGRHNTEFRVSSGGDDPLAMVAATETDGTGYGIEHYQEATTDGGAGRRRRSPQDHDQQLAYHGWAAVVG